MLQIIQYQKSGEITIADLPDIKLAPNGVLVKNYFSLISSGTERTSVETAQASMIGKAKSRPDLVKQVIDNIKKEGLLATYEKVMNRLDNYKELGYSSAGVVIDSNVEEFRKGDRVACAGTAYHSELVFIPKNLAVKVPENVSLEEAAFTTLGAIALQGVRQANVRLGENVVVIGLGLIGLITVQLLKANGCKVIGFDVNENNFELAKRFGCDYTFVLNEESVKLVHSATNGYDADSVIITASTKSNEPIERSIEFARKKGRIVLVGVAGMNIPRKGFYEKELEITISCSYGPGRYDFDYEQRGIDYPIGYVRFTEKRNMETVLQLLSQKKLDFSSLITHRIKIEDGLRAYDIITGKTNEPHIGILIKYDPNKNENISCTRKNLKHKYSKEDNIKVGFIGAGNFAKSYLLPHLQKSKVSLISVGTRKPINAKSVAEKFNFESYTTDPFEIIKNDKINTVFIATNHDSHGKYVIECLKEGKNVFVEKPLCINLDELQEIKRIYDGFTDEKPVLMVGFNRRFSKQFGLIKEFFKDRLEPFVINYRVNAGFIPKEHWIQQPEQGGRIIGEGCHFIDIFDYLIESNPVSFYSSTIRSNNGITKNEDNSIITINYQDGSIANLIYVANGDKAVSKEYCEIFSGGKTAIMDDFKKIKLYKDNTLKSYSFNGKKGHKEEVEYFIESVEGKKDFFTSWNFWDTTKITILVSESILKNQVVFL